MSQARLVCIWESGEGWAGHIAAEPDLLLYCQDGVLACSQVPRTYFQLTGFCIWEYLW
jgi:hypothetical protein